MTSSEENADPLEAQAALSEGEAEEHADNSPVSKKISDAVPCGASSECRGDEGVRTKKRGGARGRGRVEKPAVNTEEIETLQRAVRTGDEATVERILSEESKAFLVHALDSLRRTPLHLAAYEGDESMCRLLLRRGARVSATAQDNMTPLHFAALRGHSAVIALLVRKGATVDARVSRGLRTPLHMALKNKQLEAALTLIQHGANLEAKTSKGEDASHFVTAEKLALLKEAAEAAAKRPSKRTRDERPPNKAPSAPSSSGEEKQLTGKAPEVQETSAGVEGGKAKSDAEGEQASANSNKGDAPTPNPPPEKKAKVLITALQDEELAL